MAEEPKGQGGGAQLASATHLAYFMPMAIVVGMLVGRWIGGKFGHPQGGLMWGFAWGLATAFYEAFKVQKSLGGRRGPKG